jgi:hypothetical protein
MQNSTSSIIDLRLTDLAVNPLQYLVDPFKYLDEGSKREPKRSVKHADLV